MPLELGIGDFLPGDPDGARAEIWAWCQRNDIALPITTIRLLGECGCVEVTQLMGVRRKYVWDRVAHEPVTFSYRVRPPEPLPPAVLAHARMVPA